VRRLIAAITIATAALVAASFLGVAAAEAPTSATPPLRVVSVEGVGRVPIADEAEQAAADAAYHQAMTAALEDGHGKAQLLASDAGGTLGAVQSITEGSGSIECESPVDEYLSYKGAEPDFGSGESRDYAVAPEAASAPSRATATPTKKKKKKKKKKAKAALVTLTTCTLSARVAVSYVLE